MKVNEFVVVNNAIAGFVVTTSNFTCDSVADQARFVPTDLYIDGFLKPSRGGMVKYMNLGVRFETV